MLRIAQCTDSFLPVADGVGRVSYEYARLLSARGHECYVVTPQKNCGYRGGLPFEIVDFFNMPMPGRVLSSALKGAASLDMHYLQRADALKLDLVHTHSPGPAGMEAARLAARRHTPLIGSVHSKYLQEFWNRPEEKQAQYSLLTTLDYFSRCDELWTDCPEAAELLKQRGYAGNILVFQNGTEAIPVTPAQVESARGTFHLTGEPVLLCVGRMDKMKNLPRILDAAALLKQRNLPFQLVFAGHGPDEQAAKSKALALGIEGRTRFLGQVSEEETLACLYACSTLLLFPFRGVGPALPVWEAAAQGTPSLVAAGSGFSSRIQGGINGLVSGETPEEIADTIAAYLSAPERIASVRAAAKATLPIPWSQAVDRIENRYEELIAMDRAKLTRKWGIFRRELQQVDQTLEKRTMDLMWKFLTLDFNHLYAYPHKAEKSSVHPVKEAMLPRSTPEEQGISSRAINALVDAINADGGACAQEIKVVVNGYVVGEGCWTPYAPALPHQLYSLSKSITSTAIGMMVDEGLLGLDEKLTDIFLDKAPGDPNHPAYAMTVRTLLNMSTGSLFNEVGTALGADWEREFLNAGVKFPVGSQFDYNSMNTYMLAAVLKRKTGLTVTQFLTPRLFLPLGIPAPMWETSPGGTEKGGWGLMLTSESVAKIGQLYLNYGKWTVDGQERQLLSQDWIREATRPQIPTPTGEITYGYGHQIWMTAHPGAFLFNGAFGQYMLALPDKKALVVLFSGTPRLFAEGGVLDEVEKALRQTAPAPLPPDPPAQTALAGTLSALTVRFRSAFYDPLRTAMPFADLIAKLDGRVYTFDKSPASLLPMILMNVENNYSAGLKRVAFRREGENGLIMEMEEGRCHHRLLLEESGYTSAVITQRDETYAVRCGVQTELNKTGEWMLHVHVHFIETPFTRILHFLFRGDGVTLVCDESPSVKDASAMLMELAGVTRVQVVRSLMPLLRREKLQSTLRTFTTVTAQGKL